MPAFDLNALKPASSIEGLGRPEKSGPKTARQTALANIDAQLALIDAKKEGKRTFWDKVVGDKRAYDGKGANIGFFLKVGSTKLLLGTTQEPFVQKEQFAATLNGLKEAIQAGKLDDQFAVIDGAKTARTDKLRTTRAAKKAAKDAPKAE